MTEKWTPVLLENGEYLLNGSNIVLQHRENGEIGYAENNEENRQIFLINRDVNECSAIEGLSDVIHLEDQTTASREDKIEWGDETKLLLDLYYEYLPQVGPMKKFRTKKKMWEKIADDIKSKCNLMRTSVQCETRFKTMKKRKTMSQTEKHKSGNNSVNVPYQDEFDKIKSIDDSVEPEILMDVIHKVVNEKELPPKKEKKRCQNNNTVGSSKNDKIAEMLMTIHKEKEASREKRHREKMDLLERILKKPNCNCD